MLEQEAPGALGKLRPDERRKLAGAVRSVVVEHHSMSVRSGPLPDPNDLVRYNEIIPNGAERIMAMAERQQEHRHQLEQHVVMSQQRQSAVGQLLAGVSVAAALAVAAYVTVQGHDTVGGILAGTTVVGVAAVFITGKKQQEKDLAQKRDDER